MTTGTRQTSLAMLLELTGNETHTAYDGLEAVEAAATFGPTWCCWTSACRS